MTTPSLKQELYRWYRCMGAPSTNQQMQIEQRAAGCQSCESLEWNGVTHEYHCGVNQRSILRMVSAHTATCPKHRWEENRMEENRMEDTPVDRGTDVTEPPTSPEPLTDEQRALARQFLNPTSRQISPASIGFPEGLPTTPDYYHRSWIWLYATARMIASGDYTPELLVPEAPPTEDERDRQAWRLRQMFAEACRQLAAQEDSDE